MTGSSGSAGPIGLPYLREQNIEHQLDAPTTCQRGTDAGFVLAQEERDEMRTRKRRS